MASPRVRKVADRIKVIVAEMLERRIKDPRLGFVTITDVRVTGDTQQASVFYTVLAIGGEQSAEDLAGTAAALESAKGLIRSEVAKQLGMRHSPSIEFFHDALPENARQIEVFGSAVRIVGPTELIWSKCFVQLRHRYDGGDIVHTILRAHDQIDWERLLNHMEVHWEVLLIHLLNFRWIYPTERDKVPDWLLDELLDRLKAQRELPLPQMKVCRGRMFSRIDFEIDVKEWGFADVGGEGELRAGVDEKTLEGGPV